MSSVKVVIFSEDHVTSREMEALLEHSVEQVLRDAGRDPNDTLFWFLDDGTETLVLTRVLRDVSVGTNAVILKPHPCREVMVKVHHGSQHHSHAFPPVQRVERVREWAVHHFHLNPDEPWFLSTDGTRAGELPPQAHLGKFTHRESCSLKLFLAKEESKHLTVTIVNEDDGAEYEFRHRPDTKVEVVIDQFYREKLKRASREDDRLRCEKGGGNVFDHRELTLEQYQTHHCHCTVWLFAGGTGGAAWQSSD